MPNKAFNLSGPLINGRMYFEYNPDGQLAIFENHAELTKDQVAYFERVFPITINALRRLIKASTHLQVREVVIEITFDKFYQRYGKKRDRKRAESYWKKMSDRKQQLAYAYVDRYHDRCKGDGIALKYPEQYLKSEPWMDE